MSQCTFPECKDDATVRVHYTSPELPSELCKIHYEIEDPAIKGKYYQIGNTNVEILK